MHLENPIITGTEIAWNHPILWGFSASFPAGYILHAVKAIDYDVIGMVKKTQKMFFQYNGENMLTTNYNWNMKRRDRSRYLLSVLVGVVQDREVIPAKVVYARNRNKRLGMFQTMLGDNTELYGDKIDELADTFMNTLSTLLKTQL